MKELSSKLDTIVRLGKTFYTWAAGRLLLLVILLIKLSKKCLKWLDKPHTIRIRKKTIIIGVLVLLLAYQFMVPKSQRIVYAGPEKGPKTPLITKIPSKVSPLPQTALEPVQPLEPVQVAPVPTPAPVAQISAYTGTGDPYLDWIVSHESGGNPYAINASSGACGLFQALPCSKLGCSLSDITCQIAWGRSYVIRAYGSSYNAMLFWQAHNWY